MVAVEQQVFTVPEFLRYYPEIQPALNQLTSTQLAMAAVSFSNKTFLSRMFSAEVDTWSIEKQITAYIAQSRKTLSLYATVYVLYSNPAPLGPAHQENLEALARTFARKFPGVNFKMVAVAVGDHIFLSERYVQSVPRRDIFTVSNK